MKSNCQGACRSTSAHFPYQERFLIAALLCGLASASVSCRRGPARIYPPQVDAPRAAAAAVNQFDQDDDELLSAEELQGCPGLFASRKLVDKNDDNLVSADEIAERISELSREGVTGLYSVAIRFMRNGAPLSGATIELLPESFLGGVVRPARGVTSARGLVRPQTEVEAELPLHGVQPGIYRISVTGPTQQITQRYGAGDLLGLEVSEACLGTNIVFHLTTE